MGEYRWTVMVKGDKDGKTHFSNGLYAAGGDEKEFIGGTACGVKGSRLKLADGEPTCEKCQRR